MSFNNLYLLEENEYKIFLKKYDFNFKKEVLISNFFIIVSKLLSNVRNLISSYMNTQSDTYIKYIDNIESKIKLIKIIDNDLLFNNIYGIIIEYQCLFEEDINKYLKKETSLFQTIYNILIHLCNNKNLISKMNNFIEDYKKYLDKELYDLIKKFTKSEIIDRIKLIVKFAKDKIITYINNNQQNQLQTIINQLNYEVVYKINRLIIYIIEEIGSDNSTYPENLNQNDILNLKICLTFNKIVAKEVNSEIKKKININKKKLNIDISSLKYLISYTNLIKIYQQIRWDEDFKNILLIPEMKKMLEIVKEINHKEFNISREDFDNYLTSFFEMYINKNNISKVLNTNNDTFNDLFKNLKYLFILSNRYFKLNLEK
jgi:hypothetical protein